MRRIPILTRQKPLVSGVTPVINISEAYKYEHLVIPKKYFRQQNYFAIEVLPPQFIDSNELIVLAENNPIILGFLLSSVFPIWVKGVTGKNEGSINFKKTYNTFPFPSFSKKQESELLERVGGVLKARGSASGKLLSEIYCSGQIPEHLEMAHEDLDEIVLDIFGLPAGATNAEILEKLFSEYMRFINN